MTDLAQALRIAGVPDDLHAPALAVLHEAETRSNGLTLAKWKVRLFRAGAIAKLMPWQANRLLEVKPEWARYDIAPMLNITGHGDNGPWVFPEGGDITTGRPIQDYWLNQDPASDEYQLAVGKCYWCPGSHPRSPKARKAWYRRNGGEFEAWSRGMPVDTTQPVQRWAGQSGRLSVTVVRCGNAWIVNTDRSLIGNLALQGRYGYEIDNVMCGQDAPQMWYPIPGYELRAPVAWVTVPGIS
jgi:hypothetical protein